MTNRTLKDGSEVIQSFTTETGDQEEIIIPAGHLVTVNVIAGASDDVDLKIRMTAGGDATIVSAAIADSFTLSTLISSVYSVFIDINTNVSNSIKFEVRSTPR